MSTRQSGLVRMIRAQWRMTNHAMERLFDRGVAVTELIDLLLSRDEERQFDVAEDGKPLFCKWNDHIGIVFIEVVDYETGDRVKLVLSVYLSGRGKAHWESDAVDLAGKRRSMDVIKIEDMHEWAIEKTAPRVEPYNKKAKKAPVAPVETRNAFDGMPSHMLKTVRKTLTQMGLDPDDMRPVRVVGNTIDIDPTRLKRAG